MHTYQNAIYMDVCRSIGVQRWILYRRSHPLQSAYFDEQRAVELQV